MLLAEKMYSAWLLPKLLKYVPYREENLYNKFVSQDTLDHYDIEMSASKIKFKKTITRDYIYVYLWYRKTDLCYIVAFEEQ